jgi:hypothetical protein
MPTGVKPPPLNGWLRAQLSGHTGQTEWTNVFWLRYDATEAEAADVGDLNTIAAGLDNAWLATFSHDFTTSTVLESIRLLLKRASGEFAENYTFASSGARATDPAPGDMCVVVNWQTHAYFKGGHPKSFLSSLAYDDLLSTTHWKPAALATLVGHAGTWITDLEALHTAHLTTNPGFISPSFVHAGAYRVAPIERHISGAAVQGRVGAQRRRLGPTDH